MKKLNIPRPKMWDKEDNIKKKSLKQERRLAKETDFKLTPGSGMFPEIWNKEDGQDPEYIYQIKRTKKKCVKITENVVKNVTLRAYEQMKEPVLMLSLEGFQETPIPVDWVCIPLNVWIQLKA